VVEQPRLERNVLWRVLTLPDCCCPLVNKDEELPQMVATLRAAFGRHMGDPAWTGFVARLSEASPEFARMWAMQEVARPGVRMKLFKHSSVGLIRLTSTSMALAAPPETRVVVYTPMDEQSRQRIDWLAAHPEVAHCPLHTTPARG
jgi:hypothetical protein